ncbi:RhoGAP domain-containing protein [Tieghemostelium lacteum]|uniref:RhoGAP domain-containing protein n=1 Tax=Tieghemostelium lacteum TaxID=361077 RepID=A0A152A4Q2_TIELA|nr:RhoGAP domain-containing protein [Tieghemostelium lacteum]|eukprot:KYR01204.1 RhoGAP domain-containing protein [Tieghemostelium lacteum]
MKIIKTTSNIYNYSGYSSTHYYHYNSHQFRNSNNRMVAVDKSNQKPERIILVVKVPEIGLTKKILFDRVDTILDAVNLILEKLPPGSVDGQNYNIYLPQKGKWCKLDSPFSKYSLKENQEIEFKKDTRSGVSQMLSNVGNLMKPYRTIYIKLPEILQTGVLIDQQQQQSTSNNTSTTSTPRMNGDFSSLNATTTTSTTTTPPLLPNLVITSNSNPTTPNSSLSRSSSSLKNSSQDTFVKPISLTSTTPVMGIPKLNLSNLSGSSPQLSTTASSSPSNSPRTHQLEQKKSLLKIITGGSSTPKGMVSGTSATGTQPSTPTANTPRNLGTFSKSSEESFKIESFDFDDDVTLKEILAKIYQKYQHLDKDLLEDYSLIKDGEWLNDKSKTLGDYGIKHMDEMEFKRQSQKVKIIFLNRELLISLNPNDTLKDINYKIITQYLPSLIKLHRSTSVSVNNPLSPSPSSPTQNSKQSFRSSLSIEPINLLLLEQNYLEPSSSSSQNLNNNRSLRSHSDASPLSFGSAKELVLPQQQSVENVLIKRKSSFSGGSNTKSTEPEKPLSIQLGHNYSNLPQELQEFKDFKLFLSPKYINPTINNRYDLLLDEKRSLSSFNFWNNVKLYFKNSITTPNNNITNTNTNTNNNNGGILRDSKDSNNGSLRESKSILKSSNSNSSKYSVPFYLVIECEQFSCSSIVTVESSSTVYDVIRTFNRFLLGKNEQSLLKVNDSLDEFGLYFDTVDSVGKRDGFEYSGGLIALDITKSLSNYPLEPMDKLIFKRTNQLFGISPPLMQCKLDPVTNQEIPTILLELKSKFIEMEGFTVEGIFRQNNYSEQAFQTIVQSLQDGTLMDKSVNDRLDPHAIISFIKRWFMKLPKKLCQDLDDETLLYASTQDSAAEHVLLESIQPTERSLLLWLVRFLSEVVQNSALNKMNAKHLALAVGPLLIPNNYFNDTSVSVQASGSNKNLEKLNQSSLFIQHLIKLKLKEQGFSHSLSASYSISNNSSSAVSLTSASNTSSSSLLSSSLISRSPSLENFQ